VLLIDDIQFVSGKARTEEELFNIFDALYQGGKQIVITSDRLPSELPGISDRLKTRFEWGLMADIGSPDLETRMAILKQLISQDGNINFSLEVLEFLATIYKNNIRELEGAYNKVCAYCSIYQEEPTLEIVKKAINYQAVIKKVNGISIVEKTAEFFGLKKEDICGSSRIGKIAYARKIAVYIIRELTGDSWQSIGEVLGGRKYTTMMYSYDEIKKAMSFDNKLCDEINTLFNIINQI
ncbi:chromosomal replication initiator protein DnaA, partial [bacterium]|nr:chromosomal replication initiator protein DnaA [bacterium]